MKKDQDKEDSSHKDVSRLKKTQTDYISVRIDRSKSVDIRCQED